MTRYSYQHDDYDFRPCVVPGGTSDLSPREGGHADLTTSHPQLQQTAVAGIGTCGCCQQPNVHLVGTDRRGRPACADCCTTAPATTKEAP